jgi:hypothetical protein
MIQAPGFLSKTFHFLHYIRMATNKVECFYLASFCNVTFLSIGPIHMLRRKLSIANAVPHSQILD